MSFYFVRPVVVEKICELFSLVPGLAVKTEEYEVIDWLDFCAVPYSR